VRIGVVSDVHSNLPALEAVLGAMGPVDGLWCLGDFVGYGPWPNECIELLRERGVVAIAGNHDLAVIGEIPTAYFNQHAAFAAYWTTQQLTPASSTFLASLEAKTVVGQVTLAHGSPRDPVWEYLLSAAGAEESFSTLSTPLCFVGHSHVPCLFSQAPSGSTVGSYMEPDSTYTMSELETCIANPGSVGQPRDRDPRAAYLVYDTDARCLTWQRVAYDIARVQARMHEVGLPQPLADRLDRGA
jgi:diadenosine tetraphosphatase ApaH/serine/threonine PP2A family protein phosphatase